jgi:ADP-ribose pyrophosphatase YjhB (NUDIX family)
MVSQEPVRVPEVGCGAAITNAAGQLLLIQRLREPEAGVWGLPGGKIDFGELAEAAVVREIAEELGIGIELGGLACIAETIECGDRRHWVAPVYHARMISGAPKLMEPEKHGGWAWYELDDLPENVTSATAQYLAATER